MRLDISNGFPPEVRVHVENAIRYGIHFGSEGNHSHLFVRVKRDRSMRGPRGRAYDYVPYRNAVPPTTRDLVTMTLPLPGQIGERQIAWIERNWKIPRMLSPFGFWQLCVIFIAAHEGRHILDYRSKMPSKGAETRANNAGRAAVQARLRQIEAVA